MATRIQDSGTDFKDYLQSQGNAAALDYLSELERSGHKIAVKGGGYIGYIVLDCVYGYDVFASDKNKRKYAGILQSSSGIGVAAVVMAYCIVPGSVHMLVKGDNEAAVKSYVKVVNDVFEREYDDGAHSVGYPFRTDMECKEIKGRNAIWKAMGEIYGLSEGGIDGYPYNSFNYVMSGICRTIMGGLSQFSKYLSSACNVMREFSVLKKRESAVSRIKRILSYHNLKIDEQIKTVSDMFSKYIDFRKITVKECDPYDFDFTRGSSASRRPSPTKLMDSTVRNTHSPGGSQRHQ